VELSEYGSIESGQRIIRRSRRQLSPRAQLLGGGLIILAGSFAYSHLGALTEHIGGVCLFHRVTHLPCLLCGMTRSMSATAQGHLADAFTYHFLGPPLFLAVTGGVALLAAEYVLRRPILPRPSRRARVFVGWGILALLVAAWVAKLVVFGANV
jgi:hypothetical protein